MKLLYDTGEQVLGTREDIKEYLKSAVESAEDEELKEFYITETNFLLEEIDDKYKDEEYIGLSDCPMTGFYTIDMNLVKEWKEEKI